MPITVNGLSAILADGIWETTQTIGTGTYSLDGPVTSGRHYLSDFCRWRRQRQPDRLSCAIRVTVRDRDWHGRLWRASHFDALVHPQKLQCNAAVSWGVGIKDILIAPVADLFHSLQAQLDNMLTRVKTTSFHGERHVHDRHRLSVSPGCVVSLVAVLVADAPATGAATVSEGVVVVAVNMPKDISPPPSLVQAR